MNVPDDRRYTERHEWALAENGRVRVGITDYAQEELGAVVWVNLPKVGQRVRAGEVLAEVESNKTVEGVYAPLSGAVVAVNTSLALSKPPWQPVNDDPYGAGWLVVIEVEDPSLLDELLDAAGYRALFG